MSWRNLEKITALRHARPKITEIKNAVPGYSACQKSIGIVKHILIGRVFQIKITYNLDKRHQYVFAGLVTCKTILPNNILIVTIP